MKEDVAASLRRHPSKMVLLREKFSFVSFNTILVGVSFLCLYSAFNAVANTSELVLTSYQSTHANAGFGPGTGYTSLMLFNIFFAIGPFVAPFLVRVLLDKLSLIVASLSFIFNALAYIQPNLYTLYLSAAISGVFTSLLWAAGFNLIANSCSVEHLELNSTVFWLIAQFSYLFGNGVLFFTFYEVEHISDQTRYITMSILTFTAAVGTALFLLAKQPNSPEKLDKRVRNGFTTSVNTLVEIKYLFRNHKSLLLIVANVYTGVSQSFFMGIYGACLGQTLFFGKDANWLAGVSGIFVGVGQIVAALLRLVLSRAFLMKQENKLYKLFYVLLGAATYLFCFSLIFLFLPDDAPIAQTEEISYYEPNQLIAVLCSFLLGFSDCLFETEILNFIGTKLTRATPSAMALFSFCQAVGGIFVFYYTSHLKFKLRLQLLIMAVGCLLYVIVFVIIVFTKAKEEDDVLEKEKIEVSEKSELTSAVKIVQNGKERASCNMAESVA